MERMFESKEEPYELCINLQKKIVEKRDRIQDIKNFLESAKEDERAVLNEEISKELEILNSLKADFLRFSTELLIWIRL